MVFSDKFNERRARFDQKKKIIIKKGISLIPNLFTLANAFFGFCSVILAAKGDLLAASYFILLGALMDALDGRIARLVGADSPIGVQLDSLSDAISFCLAPASLVYFWQLKKMGFIGLFASAIFLLSGLWRLAKFNIMHEEQAAFFSGVPTTIAGCFLATVLLNTKEVDQNIWFLIFMFCLVLLLAALMVSSIKFPTFKQQLFKLHKNWYVAAGVLFFAVLAVLQLHKVLLLLLLLYFSSSIFTFFCKKKFR